MNEKEMETIENNSNIKSRFFKMIYKIDNH